MRLIYTSHARERQRARRITDHEIRDALAHASTAYRTPKGSTCIVGTTASGRVLKIWVVGDLQLPIDETRKLVIKSVAGKDEEDA